MKEIQKQMEEYQNLMQVKTALDMEIAVYKQLLETEEDRLGIKPENGLGRRNILCREVLRMYVFCLKYVLAIHFKPLRPYSHYLRERGYF